VRQIYTSPRVENVERVVELLNQAGIQTSLTNHRSWAGRDFRRPSYASPPERDSWPQVWIVRAEDQPKARALLREAGIEPATRFADELAQARSSSGPADAAAKRSRLVWRVRLALLGVIALLIVLNAVGVLKLF
jgi:hypothetical protein